MNTTKIRIYASIVHRMRSVTTSVGKNDASSAGDRPFASIIVGKTDVSSVGDHPFASIIDRKAIALSVEAHPFASIIV